MSAIVEGTEETELNLSNLSLSSTKSTVKEVIQDELDELNDDLKKLQDKRDFLDGQIALVYKKIQKIEKGLSSPTTYENAELHVKIRNGSTVVLRQVSSFKIEK